MTDLLATVKAALAIAYPGPSVKGNITRRPATADHPGADGAHATVSWDQIRALVAEVERLRTPESDEAWMRRVYPQHAWTPDDGIPYSEWCRLSRGQWEAKHVDLEQQLAALRQRHAEAVEKAFREGYSRVGIYVAPDGQYLTVDAAWLASETKARMT